MNTKDDRAPAAMTIHQPAPVSMGGGANPKALQAVAQIVAQAKGVNTQSAMLAMALAESVGLSLGQCINDVHVIKGKPTLSANAQLMLARRAGVRTQWIRLDNEVATLRLWIPGNERHVDETFTIEDARRADLLSNPTYRKHPKNMLAARCSGNAVRFHCPEVLGGTVYDPGEVEAIDAGTIDAREPEPRRESSPARLSDADRERAREALSDVLGDVEAEIEKRLKDWTEADKAPAWAAAKRIRAERDANTIDGDSTPADNNAADGGWDGAP